MKATLVNETEFNALLLYLLNISIGNKVGIIKTNSSSLLLDFKRYAEDDVLISSYSKIHSHIEAVVNCNPLDVYLASAKSGGGSTPLIEEFILEVELKSI